MWMTDESLTCETQFVVKWERHYLGHSPYRVVLASNLIQFAPHSLSVLTNEFEIPYESIREIKTSDNFLFRGAINIILKTELILDLDFHLPNYYPKLLFDIFEKQRFQSNRIRLFLGNRRQGFIDHLSTKSPEPISSLSLIHI